MNRLFPSRSSPPSDGASILAVDDTEQNLDIIVDALSDRYDIRVATDGQSALEAVAEDAPDLILLDIMMPTMDGLEVCRRLKDDNDTAAIPIIFLTARSETDDIVTGFAVGGADYLTKPFQVSELVARVETHLAIKLARDQIERINADQKEMLHILCHDLANPFNSVLSVIGAFGNDPEAITEFLPLMESSARNGAELIQLVREMRATEEKPLDTSAVNLRKALDESVSMLSTRLAEKEQTVSLAVDPEILVAAERVSLVNSVINNALTNASKFSPSGAGMEVTATIETEVVLDIVDHGVGIPSDLLGDLFDISKMTNRPGTDGETGTGFGMPLMRKLMEAYGGSIDVLSRESDSDTENHGTTVRLTFLKP